MIFRAKLYSIILALSITGSVVGQFSQKITVNSERKVMIESPDNFISIEIYNNQNDSVQLITNYNLFETDNTISCNVADYNFDGNKDFSLSYTAFGNTIYHIFIYNPQTREFIRIPFPNSGKAMCEAFCNIQLDAAKKRIISTCKTEENLSYTDIWTITNDGIAEYMGKKR